MNVQEKLQIVRLSAEAKANREDACLWRWFSDLAEDCRIVTTSKSGVWTITVDGQSSVSQRSFDAAVRMARESHDRQRFAYPAGDEWPCLDAPPPAA